MSAQKAFGRPHPTSLMPWTAVVWLVWNIDRWKRVICCTCALRRPTAALATYPTAKFPAIACYHKRGETSSSSTHTHTPTLKIGWSGYRRRLPYGSFLRTAVFVQFFSLGGGGSVLLLNENYWLNDSSVKYFDWKKSFHWLDNTFIRLHSQSLFFCHSYWKLIHV